MATTTLPHFEMFVCKAILVRRYTCYIIKHDLIAHKAQLIVAEKICLHAYFKDSHYG